MDVAKKLIDFCICYSHINKNMDAIDRTQFLRTFDRNVIFTTINICVFVNLVFNENTAKNIVVLNLFIVACSCTLMQFQTTLKFAQIFSLMQGMCCAMSYAVFVISTYFAKYTDDVGKFVNFNLVKTVFGSSFFSIYFAFAMTNIEYTICVIESIPKAVFKLFMAPLYLIWNSQRNQSIHIPYRTQFEIVLLVVAFYEYVILFCLYLFYRGQYANWICDVLRLHTMAFLLTFGIAFFLFCKKLECSCDALLNYISKFYMAVPTGSMFGIIVGFMCGCCVKYAINHDASHIDCVLQIVLITFIPLFVATFFIMCLLRPSFKKIFQFPTVHPENETCAICYSTDCEKFVKMHNCQHVFHPKCIKEWIERGNYNCIFCQKDVRKIK